ncbi:MAG: hypothetical protein ACR2QM_13115 [Longimicrobiales bacterium]
MLVAAAAGWRWYSNVQGARTAHQEAGVGYAAERARLLMEFPDRLRETSGVAVSRANPGIFWTHNDSGDGPTVYGVRPEDGQILEYHLDGAPARDWEDIDLAACPFPSERACLFIGDIGDNLGRRSSVSILIAEEPVVSEEGPGEVEPESRQIPWRHLVATFEDGPRDAEALAVDDAGRLMVVSKGREGAHRVYVIQPEEVAGAGSDDPAVTLSFFGELPVPPVWFIGKVVTGGAFADGELVVRTYTEVFFQRLEGAAWTESRPPCFVGHLGPGGEGLDIADDGRVYLTREGNSNRPAGLDEADCSVEQRNTSGQVVGSSSKRSISAKRSAASG